MTRFRRSLFFASLGLALACHDTTAPPIVSFKSFIIYPRPSDLVLNGSVQLRVSVYDTNQNPVHVPITWLSSSPAVMTVSDSGVVRSVAPGTAIISASAEGARDTLSIAVTSTFSQLSTEGSVTCGVATLGAAFCRGDDFYGQLGSLFPASDSTSFVPVSTSFGVTKSSLPFRAVYPGGPETCALGADSSAWCWGDGSAGELGVGPLGTVFTPGSQFFTSPYSPVLGGHKFTQLAPGGFYVCGLTTTLEVYCWGANEHGATGDQINVTLVPTPISGLQFQSIAGGAGSTCGVTPAGAAYCWGANLQGQLGEITDTIVATPTLVVGGPYQSLSVRQTICALDPDGTAYCWGASTSYPRPQPVNGGLLFTQVSSALTHGCGLTTDSSAYCWDTYTFTPGLVASPVKLSSVTAGDDWDCAVGADSAAYCWPTNCPAAFIPYCGEPQTASQVPGTHKFKAVSGNPTFDVACGQTVTDTLDCWGMNLPYYSPQLIDIPQPVPGSAGVRLISTSIPLCGLAADSTATCWRIGFSPGSDSVVISAPQPVPGGLHYSSFDRYDPRWCGTVAGQVYCGDSTNLPVSVAGATGFESVGTDIHATCGIKTGGSAYCWGSNTYGDLGIGYASGWSAHPLPVSGGHQFLSVVVSSEHGCGVAADSTIWCWGGQYVPDSLRNPPRLVPGGLKLGHLAAGFDFTCGLTSTGSAYCWGRGLTTPTPYQTSQHFQSISASSYNPYYGHADVCGLTLAGDPVCWNLPATVPAPPRVRSRLRTFSGTSFPNRP